MEGGITNGGAGIYIKDPDGQEHLLMAPAAGTCSSYRAELVALREALRFLLDRPAPPVAEPVVICTNSQWVLTELGDIYLQWVPSHCGLRGNKGADELAKRASTMDQESVPMDHAGGSRGIENGTDLMGQRLAARMI